MLGHGGKAVQRPVETADRRTRHCDVADLLGKEEAEEVQEDSPLSPQPLPPALRVLLQRQLAMGAVDAGRKQEMVQQKWSGQIQEG